MRLDATWLTLMRGGVCLHAQRDAQRRARTSWARGASRCGGVLVRFEGFDMRFRIVVDVLDAFSSFAGRVLECSWCHFCDAKNDAKKTPDLQRP